MLIFFVLTVIAAIQGHWGPAILLALVTTAAASSLGGD